MKILAFADLHGSLKGIKKIEALAKKENPEIIICAGDISIFQHGFDILMYRLSMIKKPFLFIHGNHETEQDSREVCGLFENVTFIHKKIHKVGGCVFYGYGGGGFSERDLVFEKDSKKFEREIKEGGNKSILITHAPPYGTKLDNVLGRHCGNNSISKFIKNNGISLAISGHLHENFGKRDRIRNTELINPGPYGAIIKI